MKVFTLGLCLFLPLVHCLQWETNSNDGITITACEGADVTFPWGFLLDQGDAIYNIEWLFTGPPEELLAFNSHGSFVVLPAFEGRVEHGANGALTLRHVTQNDKGSYSVEIHGSDASGSSFNLMRTVFVNVTDALLSSDRQMHVEATAVHDDVTDQWLPQLSCGDFTYKDQPAFSVEWLSPSGKTYSSSSYKDGHFLLSLPKPYETGQYTCRVPDRFAGVACLPTNITILGQASFLLDKVDLRLKILEAQQNSLKNQNLALQNENKDLKHRLTALENETALVKNTSQGLDTNMIHNLTNMVNNHSKAVENLVLVVGQQGDDVKNLTGAVNTLQHNDLLNGAKLASLENHVEGLENSTQHANHSVFSLVHELRMLETIHMQDKLMLTNDIASIKNQLAPGKAVANVKTVSFHAQLDHNAGFAIDQPVVLSHVYNNNGQAYDNTTGIFTAPINGTYVFVATTGSYNRTHDAYMELVVDGQQLSTAFAHRNPASGEMATCHGVTNLKAGQRVWLKSMMDSYFNYVDTFFSGFIISRG